MWRMRRATRSRIITSRARRSRSRTNSMSGHAAKPRRIALLPLSGFAQCSSNELVGRLAGSGTLVRSQRVETSLP